MKRFKRTISETKDTGASNKSTGVRGLERAVVLLSIKPKINNQITVD
jgi:hypothetical protein